MHDPYPKYLGVTLDHTLSLREHLVKTAGKLKNNEASWLYSWGANAETLRSSALALCYAVAEYCAPVWSRPAHTALVDVQPVSYTHLTLPTIYSV